MTHQDERNWRKELMNTVQTTPATNGEPVLAKRSGVRTMLPTTWLKHELKIEYQDGDGKAAYTSGNFLDWCTTGVILNCDGTQAVFAWERLVTIERVSD